MSAIESNAVNGLIMDQRDAALQASGPNMKARMIVRADGAFQAIQAIQPSATEIEYNRISQLIRGQEGRSTTPDQRIYYILMRELKNSLAYLLGTEQDLDQAKGQIATMEENIVNANEMVNTIKKHINLLVQHGGVTDNEDLKDE